MISGWFLWKILSKIGSKLRYFMICKDFEGGFEKFHHEIMFCIEKTWFGIIFPDFYSNYVHFSNKHYPDRYFGHGHRVFWKIDNFPGQETKCMVLPMKSRQKRWTMMDFYETWASFTSHSSELPRTWETLRYNFNTYSRRSREWRGPYPMRIAGRATFFERHSEIFRFWPVPEHATA